MNDISVEIDLSPYLPQPDWVLRSLRWLRDTFHFGFLHYLCEQKYAVELTIAKPRILWIQRQMNIRVARTIRAESHRMRWARIDPSRR